MADTPHGQWAQLRILRERTGFSLSELARQAHVSKGHLSQLENGQRRPSAAVTKKLAEALKVPITMLERSRDEDVAS